MKIKLSKILILIIILISSILFCISCEKKNEADILTLPSLPRPIAKEAVLITSAGQSTDIYIVKDIVNQLMIHNFFMPQAKETDLKDMRTLVFVVGYSPMGEKLHDTSFEDEKRRVVQLLKEAKSQNLTVVTIFIGGKERRGSKTDELLKLICPGTDYLIGMQGANYDNLLAELAKEMEIPLTLVKRVNDLSEPFASAFR